MSTTQVATQPSQKELTPAQQNKVEVEAFINKFQPQIIGLLPKFFEAPRFLKAIEMVIKVITENGGMQAFDQRSIISSVLDCASLGLDPNPLLGQAYFLPFNKSVRRNGNWEKIKQLQLIVGYKGKINLAMRSGMLAGIRVEAVYQNDEFEYRAGTEGSILHKPLLDGDRGNLVATYAVAIFKDGARIPYVCTRGEIERAKRFSSAYQNDVKNKATSSPWSNKDNEAEMAMKTAIHRLMKMLPLSPEIIRAVAIEDMNEAGKVTVRDYEGLPEQDFEEVQEVATELPPTDLQAAAQAAKEKLQREATGDAKAEQGTLI